MNDYLTEINQFITALDPASLTALDQVAQTKYFRKGDYLLQQGDVCRRSFLIKKGVARKFYLAAGKEVTTELFFENDIAVSFKSYTRQKSGDEYIQALSDLTVTATDYIAFQGVKTAYPKLAELDLMMTEYYAMWLEDRLFQYHILDAAQRYLKLMAEYPHIIQTVQVTHIASYLGISLETLSRIRARI